MDQAKVDDLKGGSDYLYFHFDVEEHHLKLETFIQTAESARKVVASLNENLFNKSLKYELIVLPPDEGSFLTKLAIWVGIGWGIIQFLDSDIVAAYIDGLTGKSPAEWAKEFGEANQETGKMAYVAISSEGKPAKDKAACQLSASIVVAMTRGVLEKDTSDLKKIGMDVGTLTDALDARAEFYAACIHDGDVGRVGFSPDDVFPIPRSSFAERAQKPPRKPEEDKPPEWTVSIESIYVTSPNWDEDDQRVRHWKGKDQSRRDCYFVIDDAEFWALVKKKDLRVDVLDNLKVQWACQIVDGRPKNRRVVRVLEYNGNKLAEPLKADALDAILGQHKAVTARRDEPSLFDDLF
ncbi:hypothetical protein IE4872_CH01895 [Rhizobium gallicum]|uniref:Uncharacterized protein n=1 Tax=Rhizobium gallicum TaxID=56730 RepID=A0A1L5NHW4_9HYPH|nr:hypothetical protein [Rhizobium gallicum]APO67516.1 hypothetical protein IE4872_CH01895 [Rhizobium gallicum]